MFLRLFLLCSVCGNVGRTVYTKPDPARIPYENRKDYQLVANRSHIAFLEYDTAAPTQRLVANGYHIVFLEYNQLVANGSHMRQMESDRGVDGPVGGLALLYMPNDRGGYFRPVNHFGNQQGAGSLCVYVV